MIKQFLWIVLTGMAGTISAQNSTPVVAVSAQGKVTYVPSAGNTKLSIKPGALMQSNGAIGVKSGGRVLLYTNGRFEDIREQAEKSIAGVFPAADNLGSLNFDTEFGRYVEAAVLLAAANQGSTQFWTAMTEPKKNGDGWASVAAESGPPSGTSSGSQKKTGDGWGTMAVDSGTPSGSSSGSQKKTGDGWGTSVAESGPPSGSSSGSQKKTGDAWGQSTGQLAAVMPFGYVASGVLTFTWVKSKNVGECTLEIKNEAGKVVKTVNSKGETAQVDINGLGQGTFSWTVYAAGNNKQVSNRREFTIGEANQREAARNRASKSKISADYTEVKRMMEAVALEKGEWFYDAGQVYNDLLKHDSKNNMVRLMYAAFLTRYGFGDVISEL